MENKGTLLIAIIAATAIALLGGSCTRRDEIRSLYRTLPRNGWAYNDTIAFPLQITDTLARGTVVVAVDHDELYKYSDLWIEMSYNNGRTTQHDTLHIPMTDPAGNWTGNGVAATFQVESAPQEIEFDTRQPIVLRHILQTDTLRNINRIGIFFTPLNNLSAEP